jgi:hypothetical protein
VANARRAAIDRTPPRPDRIRRIDGGFAFVPNRFLRDGFFAQLSALERSLYLFLVLAADRNGVSFYGLDRIGSLLEAPLHDVLDARDRLIDLDLVAFDGTRFQVLSLPPRPVVPATAPTGERHDLDDPSAATIRRIIRSSLGPER